MDSFQRWQIYCKRFVVFNIDGLFSTDQVPLVELLRVVLLPLGQHFYGHLRTEGLHDFPFEVGDW